MHTAFLRSNQLFGPSHLIWSWCSRLFVSAALGLPWMVGWSGIEARNLSSCVLNDCTLFDEMFLSSLGSRLKIVAPLTARDDSFALRMAAGASRLIAGILASTPLLGLLVNVTPE